MARKPAPQPARTPTARLPGWKLLVRKPGEKFWEKAIVRYDKNEIDAIEEEKIAAGYETLKSNW